MEKDNELDQLFKRGLNDPEIPFNELDWEKMERKLDEQKKRRILPLWIYTAGGIAAALMIFLSWFFLSPAGKDQQTKTARVTHVVVSQPQQTTPLQDHVVPSAGKSFSGEKSVSKGQFTFAGKSALSGRSAGAGKYAGIKKSTGLGKEAAFERLYATNRHVLNGVVMKNNYSIKGKKEVTQEKNEVSSESAEEQTDEMNTAPETTIETAVINKKTQQVLPETDSARVARTASALAKSKDPFEKIDQTEIARNVKKKMESALHQQTHNLILSAMAAPDISSAGDSKPAKVSSDLGMVASYPLWHNISVSSGAIYSKKYYNYGSTYGNAQQNTSVNADCNVLDVPLNVNYKLMNKKQLSVSMTAGVSSYFMLKEKYDYISGTGELQQTSTKEFINQNQHILGVANLGISFDHQISQSVSIGVQPFAKLPLTGIGQYDANLKSVGMFFSLNIGLFSPKKPGKYAALWK